MAACVARCGGGGAASAGTLFSATKGEHAAKGGRRRARRLQNRWRRVHRSRTVRR
jgi:hypothetical protein